MTNDDSVIRTVLQVFNPDYWPWLSELTRLRVENRLIRDMEDGCYSRENERCISGHLATWAVISLPMFSLKKEAYNVLVGKLRSGDEKSQDYVFKFFNRCLDLLADKPTWYLEGALIEGLKAGDRSFKKAIDESTPWKNGLWCDSLRAAITASQSDEPIDDDDVLF